MRFDNYRYNKYGNLKIKTSQGVFDSKKEYERFLVLMDKQQMLEISNLRRQVKYLLIAPQKGAIRNEKAVSYIADFVYVEDGKEIVEDVKSDITRKKPEYVIKRKLMKYIHGIEIMEV